MSDYSELSDEALEAALEASASAEPVAVPAEEAQPEPDPEPASEPVAESEPAAEKEPEPEPVPDEAEILRAQLAALEAQAKHWEQVAGRNAGELGFIKRQVAELRGQQQSRPTSEFSDEAEPQGQPAPPPSKYDDLAAWAIQQATAQAVSDWAAKHPDAAELAPTMQEYWQRSGYDPKAVFDANSPIEAQRESVRALDEAYWHAKAAAAAARKAELEQKRIAHQTSQLEAKKKAAVSATGSAPPPKPRPKSQAEMTDAELEAEMVRVTGGRW